MNIWHLGHISKRANLISFCFGLAAGFIIRDESQVPNLQLVDELVLEFESKELLLQQQRAEVEAKIKRLTNKPNSQSKLR